MAAPDSVEFWAMDEHRIGLNPILRRTWAKRGQRPAVLVNHRYYYSARSASTVDTVGEVRDQEGAKAAKGETRVRAWIAPPNHAATRIQLIARTVSTCWRCVLANPI